MASGMPVISTDTCGMPDIIEDGADGILIPTANAGAIENAILLLAQSVDLRASLGKAAQNKMRRYTWAVAGKKLEALFQFVIDNKQEKKANG
jgi:glycosyltransferase involved in cell wall biosynthesis